MRMTGLIARLASLALLAMVFATAASAAPAVANAPFGKHGAFGGRYCPFPRWACLNSMNVGPATAADSLIGYGTINLSVTGPSTVRMSFRRSLEVPSVQDSLFPIEQDLELNPQVAYALGYKSIALVQGNYAVDLTGNANGNVNFTAVLSGPINVPATTPWQLMLLSLVMLASALLILRRRGVRASGRA